jgi:hypothetical protein
VDVGDVVGGGGVVVVVSSPEARLRHYPLGLLLLRGF